jgi:hypothetical protein
MGIDDRVVNGHVSISVNPVTDPDAIDAHARFDRGRAGAA